MRSVRPARWVRGRCIVCPEAKPACGRTESCPNSKHNRQDPTLGIFHTTADQIHTHTLDSCYTKVPRGSEDRLCWATKTGNILKLVTNSVGH